MLLQMERKLKKIYRDSQKDIEKRIKEFAEEAEKTEKKYLADIETIKKQVRDGKRTDMALRKAKAEYEAWREEYLIGSEHWEEMRKVIASEMLNVNKTAVAYINGKLPQVYALNYNAIGDQTSGIAGFSFELVDASTVRNLAKSNKTLLPYKKVDGKKVIRWNTKKVNSQIMQGIIQGDSIPNIAKRLYENVPEMELASAVRNARTAVTSAENKGRMDSYHDAEKMGLILQKQWIATHDGRTRPEHLELDGIIEEVDEPFVNGYGEIMYPGDPDADPGNVYNCRCALASIIVGFSKNGK